VLNKKEVRAQVSLEFIMFIGISIIILMLFITTTTNKMINLNDDKERLIVEDVGKYIQAEIYLAYNSHSGFMRAFSVPYEIRNNPYTIEIDSADGLLYVESDNHIIILPIPKVTGQVNNSYDNVNCILKKENDIIIDEVIEYGALVCPGEE
jgi:hypothetical protein